MNQNTKQFLRRKFQDYYRDARLFFPPDFMKREWGFIFFDELPNIVMRRHMSFGSEGEVLDYIRSMVPAHVFSSAAYYNYPGAGTMKEKGWTGADLIFDLDADHLSTKAKSYSEMLSNVKDETLKLIDFLLDDFGFAEEAIQVVFSGGRGYHIHVRDPKVLSLGSPERREIVDYVCGIGLLKDALFKEKAAGRSYEKDLGEGTLYSLKIRAEAPTKRIVSFEEKEGGFGWGRRISRYLIHYLKEMSSKDEPSALEETTNLLKEYNIKQQFREIKADEAASQVVQIKKEHPGKSSQKIAQEVHISENAVRNILMTNGLWDFKKEAAKKAKIVMKIARDSNAIDLIKNRGVVDFKGIPEFFDAAVQKGIGENSVHLGGTKTDEPVTADTKRLIRMPLSLHGGSGMKVMPLKLEELEGFEPLRDAVVFSQKEIKVRGLKPTTVEMKNETFAVKEGLNNLPEGVAVYLMCRGLAEYCKD